MPDLRKLIPYILPTAHWLFLGFVLLFVSGGLDGKRIREFVEAGASVNAFEIGSYISSAPPCEFNADIHEVDGKPVAKRGRIPGLTPNSRLVELM